MSVGLPLGLPTLLAVPGLVALYFFRRRSGPLPVSALFLWRATEDLTRSGPRWQRLNRESSLLLECLAAIAAAVFISDIRCAPTAGARAHTVIVLDSSLSMRAKTGTTTVAERARQLVRARLSERGGVATLIATDAKPHVLAGPAVPVGEALEKLADWTTSAPSHPFEPSWSLATELAGADGAVLFVTDAVVNEAPKAIEVVALGEAQPNVGFMGAYRADSAAGTSLRLRVANFDSKPREVVVTLRDDRPATVKELKRSIPAGDSAPVSIDLPRQGTLTATLPDDALSWDNTLTLVPEEQPMIHIHSELPAGSVAAEAVSRFIASAANTTAEGAADLTIVPRDAKEPPPWSLVIGATEPLRGFVGPFVAAKDHPLLDDVSFDGLIWPAGASPPGRVLVSAGDRSLLVESTGPRFWLNIDLSRSNLIRTAAWPVLLGNLVELRRQTLPGFKRHNVATGERVAVTLGAGSWTLDGKPLLSSVDSLTLAEGHYSLSRDGVVVDQLVVNPLDAGESDLRTRGSGTRAAVERVASSTLLPVERSSLPLVVMLLALLFDYALAAPGRRRFSAEAT